MAVPDATTSVLDAPVAHEPSHGSPGPAAHPRHGRPGAPPMASLVRGVMILFSTQPLTWASTTATTIFVPRFLGDVGFGRYTLAFTIVGFVATLVALGVPQYLVRRIAAHADDVAADVGGTLVLTAAVAGVVALALTLLSHHVSFGMPTTLFRVALAAMVVSSVQTVLYSWLRGQERHGLFAWLNAATVVLSAALGIAVLMLGGGVVAFMLVGLLVSLGVLALSWRLAGLQLRRSAFEPGRWRGLALAGFPFLGWSVMLNIQGSVDAILLAALSTDAVVGWYAAAYRIMSIPIFVPTLIIVPLLPALSRCASDRPTFDQTLRFSLTAVILLTVPMSAMVIAIARDVPSVLGWGAAFDNSVTPMVILSVQVPLIAVNMVLGTALVALHRERAWLRVIAVAAIVNPALNLALIPLLQRTTGNGAIGAAVVTVITESLLFIAAVHLLSHAAIGRTLATVGLRSVAAGLALIAVTTALRPWSLPVAIVGGGATFALLAVALRLIWKDDVRAGIHMARSMAPRRLSPKKSLAGGIPCE